MIQIDILLDGITVRLIDKTTGKVVKEAKTADGGKYLFTDVLVDELEIIIQNLNMMD